MKIVHLCGEPAANDEKTLVVALDGIVKIVTTVEENEFDKVSSMVEQCGGLIRVVQL